MKLWKPKAFSERVVLLVEFGRGRLDDGWRKTRCEAYDGVTWKILWGWSGVPSGLSPQPSRGVKRQRDSDVATKARTSSSKRREGGSKSSANWVLIGGARYGTLPAFLGREPVKSEKNAAVKSCCDHQVELKNGDWKSLAPWLGQEILAEGAVDAFREHRWAKTVCSQLRHPERQPLQVSLRTPSSTKFLWCWAELEKCSLLRRKA